jgi:hypothetical protein
LIRISDYSQPGSEGDNKKGTTWKMYMDVQGMIPSVYIKKILYLLLAKILLDTNVLAIRFIETK